jgi:hypothetical protein
MWRGYYNRYQWYLEDDREYFENLYSNKPENLERIGKFLDTQDLLKLNQVYINGLRKSKMSNKIEESPNNEKPRTTQIHYWILADL